MKSRLLFLDGDYSMSCYQSLKSKVAFITGGGSGVGRETALMFAENGAKVCILDYNEEKGMEVVSNPENTGNPMMFIKADVSNSSEIKNAVNEVVKKWGTINILVNCAGIYSTGAKAKSIIDLDETEWNKIIDINLKGVFLTSKFVIPIMIKNKSGVIINIASEVARFGLPNISAYCASKGGVYALTKQMAIELCMHGIRVNSVSPGPLYTSMHEKRFKILKGEGDLLRKKFLQAERVPLGRPGTPNDIANIILYLSSDLATFVTGADFPVDGGTTSSPSWKRE